MLDRNQTVANLVLDHSVCAEIFQRRRIDFCCHGDVSVESAARERGLDVDTLMAELERAVAERGESPGHDPRLLATPELIAHIVSKHHEYLRRTLPFVTAIATKVGRVHGDHNPKLRELDRVVGELASALLAHLDDEERALFPAFVAAPCDRTDVARLLAAMTAEHLEVATMLERIRAASDDFGLPDWACNSYRALFSELRQLEGDIFTHVHLENHVLAPRFAAESP